MTTGSIVVATGNSIVVVLPEPVLGRHVHGDGEHEHRDDDVESNRNAEQRASGVRERQPDALQKPEIVKRDFRFDAAVSASGRHQTFHRHTRFDLSTTTNSFAIV